MPDTEHHRRLERMYRGAPVNRFYHPEIRIDDGRAQVRIQVREEFTHPLGGVHGSVYFKALDDAAYFAVNSRVPDHFVLTASFTIHFLAPVTRGEIRAEGRVVQRAGRTFLAKRSSSTRPVSSSGTASEPSYRAPPPWPTWKATAEVEPRPRPGSPV